MTRPRRWDALLSRASRNIPGDGRICVFFHNRYGIEQFLRTFRAVRSVTLGSVLRKLGTSGFTRRDNYAYYPDERKLVKLADLPAAARPGDLRGVRGFVKGRLLRSTFLGSLQPAYAVVAARGEDGKKTLVETILASLGLSGMESILLGNPNTAVITTRESIVRIPFDGASAARCRLNAGMLRSLETSPIAGFVPRFLGGGRAGDLPYFCETRLPGTAFDRAGREMQGLVRAAAEFITVFHLQTAREVIIDDRSFRRLFARDLGRLGRFPGAPGRRQRERLEGLFRKRFLYAPCRTVWSHGDCKVENILFDLPACQVRGVIDWDLSRRNSLPFLDIFYLLAYAKGRMAHRPVEEIFREWCFNGRWDAEEQGIINRYVSLMHVPQAYVRPLLVMAWLHHVVRRNGHGGRAGGAGLAPEDIEGMLDASLEALGGRYGT